MTRDHRATPGTRYLNPVDAESVISFSQNREDVRLLRIFETIETGFWVDVGAGGPEVDSMTALFADRGWNGINIEPGVDFAALSQARPNEVNLQLIVSDTPGTMVLYVSRERTGWSTTVPLAHDHLDRHVDLTPVEVEAQTLDQILSDHLPEGESIDLLKIDVEGAESSVLASVSLERWQPTVIVVEAVKTHSREPSHESWEPLILDAGYVMACFDGINRFYVPVEREDLAEALAYPLSALDDYRTASDEAERRRSHDVYSGLIADLTAERSRADAAEMFVAEMAADLTKRHRTELESKHDELEALEEQAYYDWAAVQADLDALRSSRSLRVGRLLGAAQRDAQRLGRRVGGRVRRLMTPVQLAYDDVMASSEIFAFSPGADGEVRALDVGHLIAALPAPGVLPDHQALESLRSAVESTRLNQQPTLDALDLDPFVRAAVVELSAALDLPTVRAPIHEGSEQERVVVIDARCLQDPNFAERGIGKLAAGVVGVLRAQPGMLIGLIDPLLPAMDETIEELFDQVETNPDRVRGTIDLYIDPAPMTSSIRFTRSLLGRTIVAVAIVHDFIPARHPRWYLTSAAARIEYAARFLQLTAFDHLWTNSATVAAECRERLRVGAESTAVIGVVNPMEEISAAVPPELPSGRFLFAPLGADRRKNLPAAVAITAAVRRRGHLVDLVVLSHLPHEHRAELDQLAHDVGMQPRHITAVSNLSDEHLAGFYRDAAVTIIPSFDEGYSIPVIEALACGSPVVGSDHPVHVELVGAGWWLADAGDIAAQAEAVIRALRDRSALHADQTAVLAGRDSAATIRSNIESAIARTASQSADTSPAIAASLLPAKRQPDRLAMVCPWPPSESGVALYHAQTAESLSRSVDLVVFSLTAKPVDHGSYWEFPLTDALYRDASIDHRVIVLGNSHFHVPGLELLRGFGGAVVAHDQRMTDIYREWIGEAATARLLTGGDGEIDIDSISDFTTGGFGARYGYHEIVALADPLLVNAVEQADLLRSVYDCQPIALPFSQVRVPGSPPTLAAMAESRERFSMSDANLHIGVFGGLNVGYKGTAVAIAAAGWLQSWGLRPQLHLAGGCPDGEKELLLEQVATEGLIGQVTFYGYLDDEAFEALHGAVDLTIQLRLAPPGQISGAVADAIAFGVPTVASDALAAALDAPWYVKRVATPVSPFLVAEAILPLVGERRRSFAAIESERCRYLEGRNEATYASAMLEALGIEPGQ